jgi:hypothetical protein
MFHAVDISPFWMYWDDVIPFCGFPYMHQVPGDGVRWLLSSSVGYALLDDVSLPVGTSSPLAT